MKRHPVLLRSVNKSKKLPSAAAATKSVKRRKCTTRGQRGASKTTHNVPLLFPDLFTGVDALVMRHVTEHLERPTQSDAMMLDAWERVGRQDAGRGQRAGYRNTIGKSMTPLGIACLIRYARGYQDQLEAAGLDIPA